SATAPTTKTSPPPHHGPRPGYPTVIDKTSAQVLSRSAARPTGRTADAEAPTLTAGQWYEVVRWRGALRRPREKSWRHIRQRIQSREGGPQPRARHAPDGAAAVPRVAPRGSPRTSRARG